MASGKIGTRVDAMWRQKMKVDDVQRDIKKLEEKKAKLKAKYKELEDAILKDFTKTDLLTGAAGKQGKISISKQRVPKVVSWDKFYKYVGRNKAYDMLPRKVSSTAWKERLEAGKKVPGIESVTLMKVSLTKVKK